MKVSCPQCGTAYRLPPGGLKGGQRIRCRRCSLVFDPPAAPSAGAPREEVQPAAGAASVRGHARSAAGSAGARTVAPAARTAGEPRVQAAVAQVAAGAAPAGDWADDLDPLPSEPPGGPQPGVMGPTSLGPRDPGPAFDDDPFRDLDLDAEGGAAPPPATAEARGTSAIRAQSGAHPEEPEGGTGDAPDEAAAGPGAPLTGWLARTDDGVVRPFRDLDALRAWMEAHPGVKVEVSGDGERWRTPETLLGRDVPVSQPATTSTTSLRTGTTSALRAGARGPRTLDLAGLGWGLAAAGSTLLLLGVLALNVQRMGLADLSPWIPFGSVGFAQLVPDERLEPVAEDPAAAGFAEAAAAARRAQAEGRLLQAAVEWRRALGLREDPAALAALAELYERLGEGERAQEARSRLAAIAPAEE